VQELPSEDFRAAEFFNEHIRPISITLFNPHLWIGHSAAFGLHLLLFPTQLPPAGAAPGPAAVTARNSQAIWYYCSGNRFFEENCRNNKGGGRQRKAMVYPTTEKECFLIDPCPAHNPWGLAHGRPATSNAPSCVKP